MLKILIFLQLITSIQSRWTELQANEWYKKQNFLLGVNYIPSYAVNQLEMWQKDTFNVTRINEELTWAQNLGMNTMRVFLHDLAYDQDQVGFKKRVEQFLEINDNHGIKPIIVIFDSCWDPYPKVGKQKEPTPGVHNSRWVQSPGAISLLNPSDHRRLTNYVKDILHTFANDSRILAWDLWNEPDNTDMGSYADPFNKTKIVSDLLPKVFEWARAANPIQPLTSGLWKKGYFQVGGGQMDEIEKIQLENSDIVTFHSYDPAESFTQNIKFLQKFNRPIICTEYMARSMGSLFETIIPVGHNQNVGLIHIKNHCTAFRNQKEKNFLNFNNLGHSVNWGFVNGKTQTHFPWDSWFIPYDEYLPEIWFHDVLFTNGTAYRKDEVDIIKRFAKITKINQLDKERRKEYDGLHEFSTGLAQTNDFYNFYTVKNV